MVYILPNPVFITSHFTYWDFEFSPLVSGLSTLIIEVAGVWVGDCILVNLAWKFYNRFHDSLKLYSAIVNYFPLLDIFIIDEYK